MISANSGYSEPNSPSPSRGYDEGVPTGDSSGEPRQSEESGSSKAIAECFQRSLEKGVQPLPILSRITDKGELWLPGYKFNAANAESFAEAMTILVPLYLKKVFLMDNLLEDRDVARLFHSLGESENGGIVSVTLL